MNTEVTESEIETFNKKNDDEKVNKILVLNAVYYILYFAILGLPMWYLTTTTYRAPLPFDQIDEVYSAVNSLKFQIKLELIQFNEQISNQNLLDYEKKLFQELNKDDSPFELKFVGKTRKASKDELDLASNENSLEKLDEKLLDSNIKIYVLNDKLSQKFKMSDDDFVLLNGLFLTENNLKNSLKLAKYIKQDFIKVEKLVEKYESKLNSIREMPKKRDSRDLRVVNFDSEYEITFTLINERVEKYSTGWNIESALEKTFKVIIDQLSEYTSFKVEAQTLLYNDLHNYPGQSLKTADNKQIFYLKPTDLSILTNQIESRIGTRISDSSALDFVLYVPYKQPLYILTNPPNYDESKINAYLVPRWGGVYIYNANNASQIQADEAMQTFLTQFLDLIGIELNKNLRELARSNIYSSEIYTYLLRKTIENQLNSINTLKSLSLLLNKINAMVIEDHVAQQVRVSVESVAKSMRLAKEGNLEEAFKESKMAFISSERAFFDKSLLEKLYFPDDQRFAIYIPLFVPVAIPLVMSLRLIKKSLSKKNTPKTTKTD